MEPRGGAMESVQTQTEGPCSEKKTYHGDGKVLRRPDVQNKIIKRIHILPSDYDILVLLMDKTFLRVHATFFAVRSWYSPHYSYSRHSCNGTHRGGGAKLLPVVLLLADSAARCEDSLRTKRSARAEPADRPAVRFRGDTPRERTRASIPDRQRRDCFS